MQMKMASFTVTDVSTLRRGDVFKRTLTGTGHWWIVEHTSRANNGTVKAFVWGTFSSGSTSQRVTLRKGTKVRKVQGMKWDFDSRTMIDGKQPKPDPANGGNPMQAAQHRARRTKLCNICRVTRVPVGVHACAQCE